MKTVAVYPLSALLAMLIPAVPEIRLWGNSADLQSALAAQPRAFPALFVVSSVRADDAKGVTGGLVQQAYHTVNLVLFVQNLAQDDKGAALALTEMEALLRKVRAAALNWSPDTEFYPLTFQSGRPESFKGGQLVWQDVLRSTSRIEVR